MNELWVHAFLGLLNSAPTLIGDAETVFTTIARGEGGLAKMEGAASVLLKLATDAAIAANNAKVATSA